MVSASVGARLQVDERRAQLLELGLRLFGERAYDEVSIDDIARAASVSKGLLYHYFGGKRDFYLAVIEAAAAQLLMRIAPDPAVPERERARAGVLAYLAYVDEHASAYLALMRSGVGNDPAIAAVVERTRGAIVERMLERLGLDEPRPTFRVAARSWIGQVEAASQDWLEHRDLEPTVLADLLLGALLGTLQTAQRLDPEAKVVLER